MNIWRWGGAIFFGFLVLACGSGETTTTSTSSSVSAGGSGQGGMTSSSMSVTSTVSSATGGAGGAVSSGSGGAGGSGGQSGNTCMWSANSNPCLTGEYCDAPGCGQGTCKALVSTLQDVAKKAVCGCDGINYWSEQLAAGHGMSVANTGVCMPQDFCGGIAAIKCPDPTTQQCVFDVVNKTGCLTSDVSGWCWVLPTMCPSSAPLNTHRRCNQKKCDSECDAMKSGQRFFSDVNCG